MITATMFVVLAGLGAVMRAGIAGRLNSPDGMAWGTLAVNVTGSFALGLASNMTSPAITVIGTGFLGAYTTFSSFSRDTIALVEHDRIAAAVAYVASTVVICVAAAWVGAVAAPG